MPLRRIWFTHNEGETVESVRGDYEFVSDLRHAIHRRLGRLSPGAISIKVLLETGKELLAEDMINDVIAQAYSLAPQERGSRLITIRFAPPPSMTPRHGSPDRYSSRSHTPAGQLFNGDSESYTASFSSSATTHPEDSHYTPATNGVVVAPRSSSAERRENSPQRDRRTSPGRVVRPASRMDEVDYEADDGDDYSDSASISTSQSATTMSVGTSEAIEAGALDVVEASRHLRKIVKHFVRDCKGGANNDGNHVRACVSAMDKVSGQLRNLCTPSRTRRWDVNLVDNKNREIEVITVPQLQAPTPVGPNSSQSPITESAIRQHLGHYIDDTRFEVLRVLYYDFDFEEYLLLTDRSACHIDLRFRVVVNQMEPAARSLPAPSVAEVQAARRPEPPRKRSPGATSRTSTGSSVRPHHGDATDLLSNASVREHRSIRSKSPRKRVASTSRERRLQHQPRAPPETAYDASPEDASRRQGRRPSRGTVPRPNSARLQHAHTTGEFTNHRHYEDGSRRRSLEEAEALESFRRIPSSEELKAKKKSPSPPKRPVSAWGNGAADDDSPRLSSLSASPSDRHGSVERSMEAATTATTPAPAAPSPKSDDAAPPEPLHPTPPPQPASPVAEAPAKPPTPARPSTAPSVRHAHSNSDLQRMEERLEDTQRRIEDKRKQLQALQDARATGSYIPLKPTASATAQTSESEFAAAKGVEAAVSASPQEAQEARLEVKRQQARANSPEANRAPWKDIEEMSKYQQRDKEQRHRQIQDELMRFRLQQREFEDWERREQTRKDTIAAMKADQEAKKKQDEEDKTARILAAIEEEKAQKKAETERAKHEFEAGLSEERTMLCEDEDTRRDWIRASEHRSMLYIKTQREEELQALQKAVAEHVLKACEAEREAQLAAAAEKAAKERAEAAEAEAAHLKAIASVVKELCEAEETERSVVAAGEQQSRAEMHALAADEAKVAIKAVEDKERAEAVQAEKERLAALEQKRKAIEAAAEANATVADGSITALQREAAEGRALEARLAVEAAERVAKRAEEKAAREKEEAAAAEAERKRAEAEAKERAEDVAAAAAEHKAAAEAAAKETAEAEEAARLEREARETAERERREAELAEAEHKAALERARSELLEAEKAARAGILLDSTSTYLTARDDFDRGARAIDAALIEEAKQRVIEDQQREQHRRDEAAEAFVKVRTEIERLEVLKRETMTLEYATEFADLKAAFDSSKPTESQLPRQGTASSTAPPDREETEEFGGPQRSEAFALPTPSESVAVDDQPDQLTKELLDALQLDEEGYRFSIDVEAMNAFEVLKFPIRKLRHEEQKRKRELEASSEASPQASMSQEDDAAAKKKQLEAEQEAAAARAEAEQKKAALEAQKKAAFEAQQDLATKEESARGSVAETESSERGQIQDSAADSQAAATVAAAQREELERAAKGKADAAQRLALEDEEATARSAAKKEEQSAREALGDEEVAHLKSQSMARIRSTKFAPGTFEPNRTPPEGSNDSSNNGPRRASRRGSRRRSSAKKRRESEFSVEDDLGDEWGWEEGEEEDEEELSSSSMSESDDAAAPPKKAAVKNVKPPPAVAVTKPDDDDDELSDASDSSTSVDIAINGKKGIPETPPRAQFKRPATAGASPASSSAGGSPQPARPQSADAIRAAQKNHYEHAYSKDMIALAHEISTNAVFNGLGRLSAGE